MNSKPVTQYECSFCGEIYCTENEANTCCTCKNCGKEESNWVIRGIIGKFCKECSKEEETKRINRHFESAKRITLAEYNELHKNDDEPGCLFNGNVFMFYQEDGGDSLIDENLVFGTRIQRFRDQFKDVEALVDSWFENYAEITECLPRDVAVDYEEVITFLNQWVAKQTAHYYEPDFKTAVIIPPMDEEEMEEEEEEE